jgi:hypothetical protein
MQVFRLFSGGTSDIYQSFWYYFVWVYGHYLVWVERRLFIVDGYGLFYSSCVVYNNYAISESFT